MIEESADTLSAFEIKWGDKQPTIPSAFKDAYPNATFQVVGRSNYSELLAYT